MTTNDAAGHNQAKLTTRRAVVTEALGVAVVLAIPVGVAFSTAEPVPNPPSREVLNVISAERLEIMRQRREAAKERHRAVKRQRVANEKNGRERSIRPRLLERPPPYNRPNASEP